MSATINVAMASVVNFIRNKRRLGGARHFYRRARPLSRADFAAAPVVIAGGGRLEVAIR